MADGEDAHMHAMETPAQDLAVNRAGLDPDRGQLPMRDDPMLPPRNLRHLPVTWAVWMPNIDIETAHVGHGGEIRSEMRANGAPIVRKGTRPKGETTPGNLRPVSKDVESSRT